VTVLDDVRADIAALGTLTIRDPAPGTDPHCPAWEAVGDPLLGVLAVARDWLTLDQVIRLAGVTVWRRDVATVIARVRRQLDSAGPRLRLTRAFRDELAADPAIAAAGHARIALAYRAGAAGWAEIDWSRIDRYGLRHLATHVARAGRPLADGAVDLVTPELRQALIAAFGRETGIREFAGAIALAAEHTRRELPFREALPAAVYLCGIGAENFRTTPDVPPALAGLMTRLGRLDEALDLLTALPPSAQKFHGVLAVLEALPNASDERIADVLEHVVTGALAVPDEKVEALGAAAVALAPHDLDRARRLAALVGAPADPVHRAAGRAEAVTRGRAQALLDRADAEPLSVDRLTAAVAALSTEDDAGRLVADARLAAHWRWLDAERARAHVEAVRSAAVLRPAGSTRWLHAVVDAAAALAPADADAAHWLLDRFDGMVVDEVTRPPILAAAALWAEWGAIARSEFLLGPLLEPLPGCGLEAVAEARFAGQIAQVAAIVAGFDREVARRLSEETFRRLQGCLGSTDPSVVTAREEALATMAVSFAGFAPEAALSAARLLSGRRWHPSGRDRASVLARLGMAALEAGRELDAKTLLEESLFVIGAVSTVDSVPGAGWDRTLRAWSLSAPALAQRICDPSERASALSGVPVEVAPVELDGLVPKVLSSPWPAAMALLAGAPVVATYGPSLAVAVDAAVWRVRSFTV
jgi:hypothetical protein